MTSPAFVTVGPITLRAPRKRLCSRLRPTARPVYTRTFPRAQASNDPSSDASTSREAASDPSTSEFFARFDHLRGADVEPVSATMMRFTEAFSRPVPIVYRAVINEMITTAHLARVCPMWRFDSVFAYGFDSIFSVFLRYYPDEAERDRLYAACANSLKFDLDTIKASAASVRDWLDGKTAEDVMSALKAASPGATTEAVGPVIEALAYIRDAGDFDWYYSRLFGIGLIQIMDATGVELSIANAEEWADAVGIQKAKFGSEMGTYLSNIERLKQAEQIFAELTAREAKKTAERLAAKAEAAVRTAEQLEKEQQLGEDASKPVAVGEQTAEDNAAPSA